MLVNVIIRHEWAIPRTSFITGIPEEDLRARFEEAKRNGAPCNFVFEMTAEQVQATKDLKWEDPRL